MFGLILNKGVPIIRVDTLISMGEIERGNLLLEGVVAMTTVVIYTELTGNQHPVNLALFWGNTIWGRVPKALGMCR